MCTALSCIRQLWVAVSALTVSVEVPSILRRSSSEGDSTSCSLTQTARRKLKLLKKRKRSVSAEQRRSSFNISRRRVSKVALLDVLSEACRCQDLKIQTSMRSSCVRSEKPRGTSADGDRFKLYIAGWFIRLYLLLIMKIIIIIALYEQWNFRNGCRFFYILC